MNRLSFIIVGSLALATPAMAQFGIDGAHKYSWGENIGFMNWKDAGSPAGTQGVQVSSTILSGNIWCENVGWLRVGDGTPANGVRYQNIVVAGTLDYGVNVAVSPAGQLSGFAWGENIGWVNFGGGALATPANPARVDFGANRLRGFAWGENVGWINLDNATVFVGIVGSCACDWDESGALDSSDFFAFLGDFFLGNADYNNSGATDSSDFFDFLGCFFGGCP